MNAQDQNSEVPKKKLQLRKESLAEITGWDLRDLYNLSGKCTLPPSTNCCIRSDSANTKCCPPYN